MFTLLQLHCTVVHHCVSPVHEYIVKLVRDIRKKIYYSLSSVFLCVVLKFYTSYYKRGPVQCNFTYLYCFLCWNLFLSFGSVRYN